MTRHRTVSELAALDDLTGRRRDRVRTHLADCPSCRRTLSFTREVRRVAAQVTAPSAPAILDRILDRRAAGERVILPVAEAGIPRRRLLVPLAAGATLLAAVAMAAQLVMSGNGDGPARAPAPEAAAPVESAAVGIAIVPAAEPADVRITGAPGIHVEVTLHDGPELGVRGRGAATDARFRMAGGGIVVTGVRAGVIEVRIPRGTRARLFVNDRLELTADGTALRIERSGAVRARVTLDVGR